MRKYLLMIAVLCLIGMWTVYAQDQTPTPEPTAVPQSGQTVPGFVGLDIFQRASDAYDAGNYEQAVLDYSMFIWLNPTDSQAYFQRALSYVQLNDSDHALADLSQALELPAPSAQFTGRVYNLRAAIYQDKNNTEAALADLNAGIKVSPDEPSLYYQRGVLYTSQKELDKALGDFSEAIRLAPDQAKYYADRGAIYLAENRLDEALTDFSKLTELAPSDYTSFARRAAVYEQQGNFEAALGDLSEAIKLESRAINLYLERGYVNNKLGNQADAGADYLNWVRRQQTEVNSDLFLRPGESQVVELAEGRTYLMTFRGQAGQKVTVSARAREGQSTDPLLILVDSKATPLVADDDGGGNYNAKIDSYVIPANGTYAVIVSHAGGGSDGPVRVLLEVGN